MIQTTPPLTTLRMDSSIPQMVLMIWKIRIMKKKTKSWVHWMSGSKKKLKSGLR